MGLELGHGVRDDSGWQERVPTKSLLASERDGEQCAHRVRPAVANAELGSVPLGGWAVSPRAHADAIFVSQLHRRMMGMALS